MQIVEYDRVERVSTIKINDEDLSYIVGILGGIVSTWPEQDATILGITQQRLSKLDHELRTVFIEALQKRRER